MFVEHERHRGGTLEQEACAYVVICAIELNNHLRLLCKLGAEEESAARSQIYTRYILIVSAENSRSSTLKIVVNLYASNRRTIEVFFFYRKHVHLLFSAPVSLKNHSTGPISSGVQSSDQDKHIHQRKEMLARRMDLARCRKMHLSSPLKVESLMFFLLPR